MLYYSKFFSFIIAGHRFVWEKIGKTVNAIVFITGIANGFAPRGAAQGRAAARFAIRWQLTMRAAIAGQTRLTLPTMLANKRTAAQCTCMTLLSMLAYATAFACYTNRPDFLMFAYIGSTTSCTIDF